MNVNVIKSQSMKKSLLMLFVVLALVLSGCSGEYLRDGYVPPSARSATKIPEIQQPVVRPRAAPRKVVKPYKPRVKKYSITSSTSTVISQREVEAINRENQQQEISTNVQNSIDIDPYASIPEGNSALNSTGSLVENSKPTTSIATKASPAVKSLMLRARADLAVGKTQLAISKLERGLRIESQNPSIWHLLAKAQYDQANHQQAIAMAKKSIRYSGNSQADEDLIAQNWKLIQKAGEKSDDAIAIKEALDYFKVNP